MFQVVKIIFTQWEREGIFGRPTGTQKVQDYRKANPYRVRRVRVEWDHDATAPKPWFGGGKYKLVDAGVLQDALLLPLWCLERG